jgi:drug/metabolite transporter (DMT)-like permease
LSPGDLARLIALAAMWGASYLFMRQAVPYLGSVWMIELRVWLGGAALLAFLAATRTAVGWREHWRAYLFVGAVGVALPFILIAEALKTIDASTASILNALSPLFGSLVAAAWLRERLTPAKLGGIGLCLAGTAVLVGWTPSPLSGAEMLAALYAIAATAIYGFTSVFTKVKLAGARPLATGAGTLLMAAVTLLPFSAATPLPANVPALAWLSLAGLALICTSAAFILYYRLIADIGPVKAITVTLLVPIFGMLWGVLFLGEAITPGRVLGCATILVGCSLILGIVKLPRGVEDGTSGE